MQREVDKEMERVIPNMPSAMQDFFDVLGDMPDEELEDDEEGKEDMVTRANTEQFGKESDQMTERTFVTTTDFD